MGWFSRTPKIDHDQVVAALRVAEATTSGEIRVLMARHKAKDPVAAAQSYFNELGMAQSPHRNGILIFVAPRSRNFAVVGDQAVHEQCGDAFWTSVAEAMADRFRAGQFTDGLVHGIDRAGELLARTFPRTPADRPPPAPEATEVD
jgi:uncharacterized membrane protein